MPAVLNIPCFEVNVDIVDQDKFYNGQNIMRWLEEKHMRFITTHFTEFVFTINCINKQDADKLIGMLIENKEVVKECGCKLSSATAKRSAVHITRDQALEMIYAAAHKPENTGVQSIFVPQ